MIKRDIQDYLIRIASQFRVVGILGPRQSGKTTLAGITFNKHTYISLEDLDTRLRAQQDPRAFLQDYPNEYGIIIDEIQHVPELLSYIQTIVDQEKKNGFFVLTGSQNLLINQAVTQTLAGRIAILTLLPLSIHELTTDHLLPTSIDESLFKGLYPRIYDENIDPYILYSQYIDTYIQRDVRDIKNITNLTLFKQFLILCAGRVGQVLNFTSLGNDLGVDQKTITAWISVLEASYTIFLLYPYYKNFGKRLIKSPKIYFIDSGVVCSLLNIKSPQELSAHYIRGNLFESYIISDFLKQYYNTLQRPSLYFWRDYQQNEIDCVLEDALTLSLIEIKAGKTVSKDYFKQFAFWKDIPVTAYKFVIYGGGENQSWPEAKVIGWQNSGDIVLKSGLK